MERRRAAASAQAAGSNGSCGCGTRISEERRRRSRRAAAVIWWLLLFFLLVSPTRGRRPRHQEPLSTGEHESKHGSESAPALTLPTQEEEQLDQEASQDYLPLEQLLTSLERRSLSGPGSSPPQCTSKCGRCVPCRPVHVPIQPGLVKTAEYYPEAWRCKCGNKLFMP